MYIYISVTPLYPKWERLLTTGMTKVLKWFLLNDVFSKSHFTVMPRELKIIRKGIIGALNSMEVSADIIITPMSSPLLQNSSSLIMDLMRFQSDDGAEKR